MEILTTLLLIILSLTFSFFLLLNGVSGVKKSLEGLKDGEK